VDQTNVLLIVCDTLRVDHLGCYGYFRETSPNINYVAEEGVVFEDFYDSGSPTGPCFTCIYTGLHTIHHKFYQFLTPNIRQVDDTIFTMPEIMHAMGYTTTALDNLIKQSARAKHFVRGYEFYINWGPGSFRPTPADMLAEQLNRRLIPWIRNYADEKFFLLVHYWDPHTPYNQPEEYRRIFRHEKGTLSDLKIETAPAGYKYIPGWGRVGEFADGEIKDNLSIDLYDGEICYMDQGIGEVISTLEDVGVLDDTLVIVTSDHGENLLQHYNSWGHESLHDAVTHVPLIMRYPKKLPKGVRVKGFCQHIDLLPTIMDLVGATTDVLEIDGESIMPLLKGKQIRDRIFMEACNGQRAIRTSEWKLLDSEWMGELLCYGERHNLPRKLELYNVKDDPMETINLAENEKEEAKELKEALREWVKANLIWEPDPAVYEDLTELFVRGREYRQNVEKFLKSLGIA